MKASLKQQYEQERERLKQGDQKFLEVLSARERKVLELRLGLSSSTLWTLEAIGEKFKLTKQRIGQIEKTAIRKILKARRLETSSQ